MSTIGRPPHEPTPHSREQVEAMAGLGMTHDEICLLTKLSGKTLRKHYAEELDAGAIKMHLSVKNRLRTLMTQDDDLKVAASTVMFFLKTQCGWSEKTKHEHTGADGDPLTMPPPLLQIEFVNPGDVPIE